MNPTPNTLTVAPKGATTTAASAVATTAPSVKGWLQSDEFRKGVEQVLPKHLTPDRFVRMALSCITRQPKLAECDPHTVLRDMMTLSQLGIEPDGRRAHLIPFWNSKRNCYESQLIVDYKGLVELAMRAGTVANIHADTVCENDLFEYDRGDVTTHKIDFRKPRGEMYAVYCRITFKDETCKCEVMSKEDVDKIRNRSKAAQSGPWVTDYAEMSKKTVFRRASKWIVLSPEVRDAFEADEDIVPSAAMAPARPKFLEAQVINLPLAQTPEPEAETEPAPKRRGRPPGSVNKATASQPERVTEPSPAAAEEDDVPMGDSAPADDPMAAPSTEPEPAPAGTTPAPLQDPPLLDQVLFLMNRDKIDEENLLNFLLTRPMYAEEIKAMDKAMTVAKLSAKTMADVIKYWDSIKKGIAKMQAPK